MAGLEPRGHDAYVGLNQIAQSVMPDPSAPPGYLPWDGFLTADNDIGAGDHGLVPDAENGRVTATYDGIYMAYVDVALEESSAGNFLLNVYETAESSPYGLWNAGGSEGASLQSPGPTQLYQFRPVHLTPGGYFLMAYSQPGGQTVDEAYLYVYAWAVVPTT